MTKITEFKVDADNKNLPGPICKKDCGHPCENYPDACGIEIVKQEKSAQGEKTEWDMKNVSDSERLIRIAQYLDIMDRKLGITGNEVQCDLLRISKLLVDKPATDQEELRVTPPMIKIGHPESKCLNCGRENIGWFAPNYLWNKVMGENKDKLGVVCPHCFSHFAENQNITVWFKADNINNLK